MKRYLEFIPLGILILIFLWITLQLVDRSIDTNGGHWVYALDDPYIHMALAKNLVKNGTWGISPGVFSSASSSTLWTLLNALFFLILGINELSSLILCFIFAILSIMLLYRISMQLDLPGWLGGLLILPVIYLAPLPAMVLSGMEHLAHLALSLAVMSLVLEVLTGENVPVRSKVFLWILVLGLSAVRYEGLFLGFVIAGCMVLKRRFKLAAALAIAVVLPIIGYGLISVRNGSHFIPNPLLIKSDIQRAGFSADFLSHSFEQGFSRLGDTPIFQWLFGFSLVFLVVLISRRRRWVNEFHSLAWMHGMFLGMLIPHILWAGFGWFYRYEMYLVAIGVFIDFVTLGRFILSVAKPDIWQYGWRTALAIVIVVYASTFFNWRLEANRQAVTATTNIYEQQVQMARFLAEYYPDEPVAINDIGAISFYTDAVVIDLVGLANWEVTEQIVEQDYDTDDILRITSDLGVRHALVYDSWFQGNRKLPASWMRAGQWTIQNNVVCGDDTVAFYALDPSSLDELVQNLDDFSSELPKDVIGYISRGP